MGENTEIKKEYDFFISFADDAKGWVHGVLVEKLVRAGKKIVLDNEITGNTWLDDIQHNIQTSDKVLVVVTPQYCTSQRNHLLQLMAFTKGVENREWPVIPILLKSVELELFLRFINGVNLTQYQSEDQLDILLDIPPLSLTEEEELRFPPYPGMVAFKEEDASQFFGREDEIDRSIRKLNYEHALVLIGASGCGKSSLARAGIIPKLKSTQGFLVKIFRPIDKELDIWLEELTNELKGDTNTIKSFLFLEEPKAEDFLLFIDQFEELFIQNKARGSEYILSEKAKKLLNVLDQLKIKIPDFNLLITLRADYFPQLALCQTYIDFDQYLQRVNALDREGLIAAISKPALKKRVFIDERLVERLVNDAGDDPGILPFVQETMRDLWRKRTERYIDLETYESLGEGTNSGLKASIAAKADAAYKQLTEKDQEYYLEKGKIAKRIFIRLIQFGDGKPDTRRQQSVAALRSDQDIVGVFDEVLWHLSSEEYRLLTINRRENDEDSKIDIVHEALIKAWPLLQEWIFSLKELEQSYRYLSYQSERWKKDFESKTGLLDTLQLKMLKPKWELVKQYGVSQQVNDFWSESIRHNHYLFYKQNFKYLLLVFIILLLSYSSWYLYKIYVKQAVIRELEQAKIESGDLLVKLDVETGEQVKKIRMNSFFMDKYEVNNKSVCQCVKVFTCKLGSINEICNKDKELFPAVNIGLADSQVFCKWLGRRLPLEIEWEMAAKDIDLEGLIANERIMEPISVKDLRLDKTREGVYGLYGNISEWTLSEYDKNEFFSKNIWSESNQIEGVVLKGGSFDFIEVKPYYFRIDRDSKQGYQDVGFRCVSNKNSGDVLSKIN